MYDKFKELGDYDHMLVLLRMTNDALGLVEYSGYTPYGYDTGVEIHGSKGKIIIGMGLRSSLIVIQGANYVYDAPTNWVERYEDAYLNVLLDFVDSILNDGEPRCTIYDGRKALEVALAAWKSIREKKPVNLPLMI